MFGNIYRRADPAMSGSMWNHQYLVANHSPTLLNHSIHPSTHPLQHQCNEINAEVENDHGSFHNPCNID